MNSIFFVQIGFRFWFEDRRFQKLKSRQMRQLKIHRILFEDQFHFWPFWCRDKRQNSICFIHIHKCHNQSMRWFSILNKCPKQYVLGSALTSLPPSLSLSGSRFDWNNGVKISISKKKKKCQYFSFIIDHWESELLLALRI